MQRRKLLVVDDEPAILALIKRAGEACGYEVITTSEAGDFKLQFISTQVDVIGLDLGMPDIDGIELLRFLSDERCQSQLIIISGFDRRILDTALRLGEALGLKIAGTFAKPVKMAALRNLLAQLGEAA
jgi:DNA-binding response OmpR family regulator